MADGLDWVHVKPSDALNPNRDHTTPRRDSHPLSSHNDLVPHGNSAVMGTSTSAVASIESKNSNPSRAQASSTDATTHTEQPPQLPEQRPCSPPNQLPQEPTSHDTRAEADYQHAFVRNLTWEVSRLRFEISERKFELRNLDTNVDEEEQNTLKALNAHAAQADPQSEHILVEKKLVFDAARIISRIRDDRGPVLDDIHQLEDNLNIKLHQLAQAQERLHQSLKQLQLQLDARVREAPNGDICDGGYNPPAFYSTPPQYPYEQFRVGADDDTDSEASEVWRHGPPPDEDTTPKYHPTYVQWQHQVAQVGLTEDRLDHYTNKQEKLLARKAQRETVGRHLSKEDEEELVTLPGIISEYETELKAARGEAGKLKGECKKSGIIDENDEPVEVAVAMSENGRRNSSNDRVEAEKSKPGDASGVENDGHTPMFEEWVITAAARNINAKRPPRKRWAKASITQRSVFEALIIQAISELDEKAPVSQKLGSLGTDQRAKVKEIEEYRTAKEQDPSVLWTVAQFEHGYKMDPDKPDWKIPHLTVYLAKSKPTPQQEAPGVSVSHESEAQAFSTGPGERSMAVSAAPDEEPPPPTTQTQHLTTPNLAISPPSENEVGFFQPIPVQQGYLKPTRTMHARSRTSGLTHFALTASSHGVESPIYGGMQSRIAPWMLQILAYSRTDVRLLATIVQAMGTPLFVEPFENTAELVLHYWSADFSTLEEGDSWAQKQMLSNLMAAKSTVQQAGYDIELVKLVAGFNGLPLEGGRNASRKSE